MNAHEVIRQTLQTSQFVLSKYLEDLSDADLLRRPGPGCNHLAWQLGHLIASASQFLEALRPGYGLKLPEGFAERHSPHTAGSDNPADFCSKQEYLTLLDQTQQATLALLDQLTKVDLDQPGPEQYRSMFPTVGSILILIATHPLMHAGQFVPVRRALGKPVVI